MKFPQSQKKYIIYIYLYNIFIDSLVTIIYVCARVYTYVYLHIYIYIFICV